MLPTTGKTFVASFWLLSVLTLRDASAQANTTTSTTTTGPAGTTTTTSNQQPPAGVELEIGMGSRIGGPAVSNYQSNNGVLSLTSLGRATPQFVTGLGFSFCESGSSMTTTTTTTPATDSTPSHSTKTSSTTDGETNAFCKKSFPSRLGVFVSAQFGAGSNQTISGYSVGMTFGLSKYLRLLAGFSLTPVNQISPGFANAAAQYVSKNPSLFPGIDPNKLATNAFGAFDGIQTTGTAPAAGATPAAAIYYPGSVTETHYRGGLLIGIALPINIFSLLGGNKTGGTSQ